MSQSYSPIYLCLIQYCYIAKNELTELGINPSKLVEASMQKNRQSQKQNRQQSESDETEGEGEESEAESSELDSQDEEDYDMVRRTMPGSFVGNRNTVTTNNDHSSTVSY